MKSILRRAVIEGETLIFFPEYPELREEVLVKDLYYRYPWLFDEWADIDERLQDYNEAKIG